MPCSLVNSLNVVEEPSIPFFRCMVLDYDLDNHHHENLQANTWIVPLIRSCFMICYSLITLSFHGILSGSVVRQIN
jgi:hypothetical protein